MSGRLGGAANGAWEARGMSRVTGSSLTLLDWRRRTFALYAEVRAAVDPRSAHERWRAGRDALFRDHPDSPLSEERRRSFTTIPVATYDPAFRFVCRVVPAPTERREVPTGTDGVVPFERAGRVEMDGLGSLDVWRLASYGGGLFIPLRDATAGDTTYGGGRYLVDTVKGADLGGDVDDRTGEGTLVIDLNFAYHPSCAYDPEWACPLAPNGNVLAAPVEAGEQLPNGGWY
jgi:uncharacterized protein (DUF1684 family)